MKNLDYKNAPFEQIFDGVYGYKKPYNPMKADLKDRVALVTGATGMIGSATAELLAASGAKVAIWGRNDAKGQLVESKIREAGGDAKYYHVDVVDRAMIDHGFKEVINDYGRIDILFANAGSNFSNRKPVPEYDSSMFDQNIDINLNNSSVYLTKLVIPGMIAQGGGSIIFTSSICGVYGLRNQSGFVASKFAICALTKSLALEYAKYGIRVNTLAPGSLPEPDSKLNPLWATCNFEDYDSNFENPSTIVYDIPARRPAYPTDMAGIILYFASDDASYTTGQVIVVDGGWTAGFSGDY